MPASKSKKTFKKLITKETKAIVKDMIKESSGVPKPEQKHYRQEDGVGSYRITVRPKNQYTTFRTQEIVPGLKRIAGRRFNGTWVTVTWLVSKDCARLDERECLIISNRKIHVLMDHIKSPIKPVDGDVFKAEPVLHAPELPPPVVEVVKAPVARPKPEKERKVPIAKPRTLPTKKAKILAAKAKKR